jgi:hypothetical protein
MNYELAAYLSVLVIFSPSLFLLPHLGAAHSNDIDERILPPLFRISTRDNIPFNTTESINDILENLGGSCPSEIAVYIHGFWRDESDAQEEFLRTQASLIHSNYRIPFVGFSWDSKADPDNLVKSWQEAKMTAKDNGPKLAKFITDFKEQNNCPNINVHIISHSLGASVVNSTLVYLSNSLDWNNNTDPKIHSVHLLGAAIDNDSVARNASLGNAIENVVNRFYNLYDPEDNGLEVNRLLEGHEPLGMQGAPIGINLPVNYVQKNVIYEIPPFVDEDADGNLVECFAVPKPILLWGDNHCGYIGFRYPFEGSFRDDGVIDVVVRNWINS